MATSSNDNLSCLVGTGLGFALGIAALCLGIYWLTPPSKDILRLFAAVDGIEITSLEFVGPRQRANVTGPEALTYMTNCFRSATKQGHSAKYDSGYSYDAFVGLSVVGRANRIRCNVSLKADALLVTAYPAEFDDPEDYRVEFPQPMPDEIASVLVRLRNPADVHRVKEEAK